MYENYAVTASAPTPNSGAVATAAGVTSHSGGYIPEIWSSKILEQFYAGCLLPQITNSDYEGEITGFGDTVKIRTGAHISDAPYSIGMKLQTVNPQPGIIELLINQARYYQFSTNPLVIKQSDLAFVNQWSRDAAMSMKIGVETRFFAAVYAQAADANQGLTAGNAGGSYNMGTLAAPYALSAANAVEFITWQDSILTEQNVPSDNRFSVLPEVICNKLINSDKLSANTSGDAKSAIRTGLIGRIGKLDIYSSNLLNYGTNSLDSGSTCFNPIFGHKSAMTFAWQLVKDETLKNPDDFGDLHRGLQVYGYKVVRPEALGTCVVKVATS